MLVGRHGIGKSDIIREFYSGRGMPVVSFFLGQMSDPGDLIGLMHQNRETGRSEFMPPYWWPQPDQPVVLFLDELNRARPEILQSVMELTLNKTLAGKRLPEGSLIVSAVNEGDQYELTDLDPALVSRFNVYHFSPSVEDWLDWATANNLDRRLIEFLGAHPHLLDGDETQTRAIDSFSTLEKTPDRRAWARVSDLLNRDVDSHGGAAPAELAGRVRSSIGDEQIRWIAGVVGTAAATTMRNWLATELPVSADQVLFRFEQCRDLVEGLELAELSLLNERILESLNAHAKKRLVRPDESPHPIDAAAAPSESSGLDGLECYWRSLTDRKLNEAIAHLVALSDEPRYAMAMDWMSQSPEIATRMADFIDGISLS